uniref:Uncharacterized protein n=1 Tax=Rhizophora mucronata TaxID=61149 RepID=A0A2P2JAI1_RHIMU
MESTIQLNSVSWQHGALRLPSCRDRIIRAYNSFYEQEPLRFCNFLTCRIRTVQR